MIPPCRKYSASPGVSIRTTARNCVPSARTVTSRGTAPERVVRGRYVLPDGSLSRDPLGHPVIKCDVDMTYQPNGPATGVFIPPHGRAHPKVWMALDGRPQSTPDRNTRGYFDKAGNRVWINVFPNLP